MTLASLVGNILHTKINYPPSSIGPFKYQWRIQREREKGNPCLSNGALGKRSTVFPAMEQWRCQLRRRQYVYVWKERSWPKSLLLVPEDSHSPACQDSLSFSHAEPQKILFCLSFMNIPWGAETPSSSQWMKTKSVLVSLPVWISRTKCGSPPNGLAPPPRAAYTLDSGCVCSTLRFRNECLQLSAVLFNRNIWAGYSRKNEMLFQEWCLWILKEISRESVDGNL